MADSVVRLSFERAHVSDKLLAELEDRLEPMRAEVEGLEIRGEEDRLLVELHRLDALEGEEGGWFAARAAT